MIDQNEVAGCASAVVIALIFIAFCCFGGFSCWNKYVHGNKQFVDMKQNFSTAYIKMDGKTEKVAVKCWNDYDKSDTIQVVAKDGKVYYTHSVNVILTNE